MSAADALVWLRYADEDQAAAQRLLGGTAPGRIPAWHAQQAAEKALKAVLVAARRDVPKTHDLAELARLVGPALPGAPSLPDLAELASYAVQPRYPDDLADVSDDEAMWAVELAAAVLAAVRAALGR